MERFYRDNDAWLRRNDHNHLRITRILKSVSLLCSKEDAREFHAFILGRVEAAQPVTEESLGYWKESIPDMGGAEKRSGTFLTEKSDRSPGLRPGFGLVDGASKGYTVES